MAYFTGVTFICSGCGSTWSLDWTAAQILDHDLCVLSYDDGWGQNIDLMDRMVHGEWQPVGDPDHNPDLGTLVMALPLPYSVSERAVSAVLAWRRDPERYAEQYA
jgi:hypothetical protein